MRTAPATWPPSENSCRSVHFCAHPGRTSTDGARWQDGAVPGRVSGGPVRSGAWGPRRCRSGVTTAARCSRCRSPSTSSTRWPWRPSSASASWPGGSAWPRAPPTGPARSSPSGACSTGRPPAATASGCASSSTATWPPRAQPIKDRGLPLLVELRNALGETVQIGVPAGSDVVYVERVEGVRALRYSTENSRRSPLHRSSAGKTLMAFHPELVEARLRAGLPASTGYTIVVPEVLVAELARIRERGYARSVDETELGMSSLAVPVPGPGSRPGRGGHLDGRPHHSGGRRARGPPRRDPPGRRPQARRGRHQGRLHAAPPRPLTGQAGTRPRAATPACPRLRSGGGGCGAPGSARCRC